MFTGIIHRTGVVRAVERRPQSRVLTIDATGLAEEMTLGDSVSVDGACLTVTRIEGARVSFDVGAETLRLTTLGQLREGRLVNLEPSLRVGDLIGGHFVSGHVDGVGTISQKKEMAGEVRMEVEVDPRLTDQMIMKGSVAVDGISLTIAALEQGSFEVSLIPHTLAVTTLGSKGPGDRVNIECDMIGRWVRRLLGPGGTPAGADSLTIRELGEQGF